MKCSIVIATKNKADCLEKVLVSIFKQYPPFEFEVIVTDDGSTDKTPLVCGRFNVQYHRLENKVYRNPSVARNVGYRHAKGDIIIAQSDDVIHAQPNTIEELCRQLKVGEFVIATVKSLNVNKVIVSEYTGNGNRRPYFFLGSLWRYDLYAIGGNDEEFISPGYDDNWFADCLTKGLGLKAVYANDIIGYHQDHWRPSNLEVLIQPSKELYAKKLTEGKFEASGGPWKYDGEDVVKEWWEEKHEEQAKRYLSGYTGAHIWKFFNIENKIVKDKVVLEVGVGMGRCTKDLHDKGMIVYALDISEVGLKRVAEWIEVGYQRPEELPGNAWDLVIIHLVAQHLSDVNLKIMLRHILRGLKSNGMIALQFANSGHRGQTVKDQMKGGVCRSMEEMKKIISEVGGKVLNTQPPRILPKAVVWYGVHIVK